MRALWFGLAAAVCLASTPALGLDAPRPQDGKQEKKKDAPAAKFGVEVLVLHATNEGKGIDPKIGSMPQLKKPPFNSYDSYALLSKTSLPLEKGKPAKVELPTKRVLRTELISELPKGYIKLSASINQPDGKDFLPLLEVKAKPGQSFMLAGQSYKGGMLVLVIRVVLNSPEK